MAKAKFQLGDIVQLVSKDGEWNSAFSIGILGTVVKPSGWRNRNGADCVGVDWGISLTPDSGGLHNLNGALPGRTGYWVQQSQICLAAEQGEVFEIDDLSGFWEE